MKRIVFILATFAIAGFAHAQNLSTFKTGLPIDQQRPSLPNNWIVEEVTDGSVSPSVFADKREKAPNGLPDGRIVVPEKEQDIAEAYYSEPTNRYRHGVLGDAVEAGALRVVNKRGQTFTYRLPRTEVFEDITPRLADIDGNGTTEVITILSQQGEGASIAVFGLNGNAFVKLAQSPFIGRGNRWLNIAGIDHYSGRHIKDIAIVETPHLAGLFKLYSFNSASQTLTTPGTVPGFSNHQIGSGELRLSATALVDNDRKPDLILPSLDRSALFMIALRPNQLQLLSRIDLPARVDRAILAEGNGADLKITLGLDDGKIYKVTWGQQ